MKNELLLGCLLALDIGLAQAQTPPAGPQGAPPLQGDGASVAVSGGVASLAGTITKPTTFNATTSFASGNTFAANGQFNINSGLGLNAIKVTGSTCETLAGTGGVVLLEGTCASHVDQTAETAGRYECWENYESTSVTITSSAGSIVLAGTTTGVGSITLATGVGKCFVSDGMNHLELLN